MKQSAFGLPSAEGVPRVAGPAYKRLMATIHSTGMSLVSTEEAKARQLPFLELRNPSSQSIPYRGKEGPVEGFEVRPAEGGCVLVANERSLPLGLEEVRRQFLAIYAERIQEGFRPFRCKPRVPLRGIRIDLESGSHESMLYDLEKYGDYGLNAVLIDPLDPPSTNGDLADESRSAGWESRLRHTLEVLGKRGLWRMPVLPFELDLAAETSDENPWKLKPLCRQDPRGRRRLLSRFESIVRLLPQVEAVGLAIADWDRCHCDWCSRTSFQEEVAYYLRGYLAILKRYVPTSELWILPDENSWEALEEVGLQVPETIRWLYSPEEKGSVGERKESEWNADGIQFTLPWGAQGAPLDPDLIVWFDGSAERERETRLAVAALDLSQPIPVQFTVFLWSAWEFEADSRDIEESLFRLVLPSSEWRNWRLWKANNRLLMNSMSLSLTNGNGLRKTPHTGGWGPRIGPTRRPAPVGDDEETLARIQRLAAFETGTPYSFSPGPSLIGALVAGAKRWLAEREIESILVSLREMPEAAPIDGRLKARIADLRDAVAEFLDSPSRSQFEQEELRGLESLRDHLALHLGGERPTQIWEKEVLPPIWIHSQARGFALKAR